MALRTFAPQTFAALAFAALTLQGTGGSAPPVTITPYLSLTLPARAYSLTLGDVGGAVMARSYAVTLVARSPQLTLPSRSYVLQLPPRGQGDNMAQVLDSKQPSETFHVQILAAQYLPPGRTID